MGRAALGVANTGPVDEGRELQSCKRIETRSVLVRPAFFNLLSEIRDPNFELQRYRASGLNLVTAVVGLWSTTYRERATCTVVLASPDDKIFCKSFRRGVGTH
jgi:Tn3 transposase DDE domain